MVSIKVKRSLISGKVRCPSSKSYTHRAIAVGSLAESESRITNPLLARDTLATISACRLLGASIEHNENGLYIAGKHSFDPPDNIINAENSGTTIRLMAAMSALVTYGFTVITGDESLRKRPMQPIIDALNQLGVQCHSTKLDGTAPLIIKGGGIKGGRVTVDGTVSSQFISALLISGIYADSDIDLKIAGNLVSKPYVEATLSTMKSFGVDINHNKEFSEYFIRKSSYRATNFDVPSDFSTAALMISAGILAGEKLVIDGLNFELPQGDSKIIDIVRKMGGEIITDRQKGQLIVYGAERLEGNEFNLGDTPDLLPVVSILALKCKNRVDIKGVAHARLKETDRISNIASQLVKLGATVNESHDGLSITPPARLKNASLEAFNDHRLFMAFTIASMLTEQSVVAGAESVDVSYPNFIQDIKEIGGIIE